MKDTAPDQDSIYKEFGVLFKKQGNLTRYWKPKVSSGRHDVTAVIRIEYGFWENPDSVQTSMRTVGGKNIGKANATTPFEQATNEVIYQIKKMLRQNGYVMSKSQLIMNAKPGNPATLKLIEEELQNAPEPVVPHAMKLHHARTPEMKSGSKEYKKSRNVTFPAYVQPKLDGVFCTAGPTLDGLYTRGAKDRLSPKGEAWKDICPQIYEDMLKLQRFPYIFNGEVYIEGSNLQEITSACQSKDSLSGKLKYHIFDIVDGEDFDADTPYFDKLRILDDIHAFIIETNNGSYAQENLQINHIDVITTDMVHCWADINGLEQCYLIEGEEGIVIRNIFATYKPGKRSSEVLKLVRMDDSDVLVVDIVPMDKEPSHGMFVCQTKDGKRFNVTPSNWDHLGRMDIIDNPEKYIGKYLKIKHRGYTNDGIPRIATGVSIRGDEH